MRLTTFFGLAAVLGAFAIACSGSSPSGSSSNGGGGDNGGAASTGVANNDDAGARPSDPGPGSNSSSGVDAGSSPSVPSNDAGSAATNTDGGQAAVDAGPAYDPNACECIPNATRWCDPGTGSDWGKQTCTAGGTWGACVVASDAPANCKYSDVGFSMFCCLDGSTCCEDKGVDLGGGSVDPNGLLGKDAGGFNGSMSVGACDQIACPNAIVSNPWHK